MNINPMTLILNSITSYAAWTDEQAESATKALILKVTNDLDEGYEPSSLTDDEIVKFNETMDEIERDIGDDDDSDDDEDNDNLRDTDSDDDDDDA